MINHIAHTILRGVLWGLIFSIIILASHAGLMPFQMLFQPLAWP